MKVVYQESASDDVVRQFRYYLVTLNLPEIALRFRDSVHRTIQELRRHPQIGAHYQSTDPKLENLRAWPITGFESVASLLCHRKGHNSHSAGSSQQTRR